MVILNELSTGWMKDKAQSDLIKIHLKWLLVGKRSSISMNNDWVSKIAAGESHEVKAETFQLIATNFRAFRVFYLCLQSQ